MKDEDIWPGVMIENIHWPATPGHTLHIHRVAGHKDDDVVETELRGPAGSCILTRSRKLIRDHFRIV